MRIAELSRRAGVPVPTIKYYLREGLLAPGVRTSPNQSSYDEGHVRRLKLIRALVEIGGLSITDTRSVLAELDEPSRSVFELLGKVQYALVGRRHPREDESWASAAQEVTDLINRHGWSVWPDNPGRDALTELVVTLRRLGQEDLLALVDDYAAAAEHLAGAELAVIRGRADVEAMVEGVVLGTVLGDALLTALRRLAQEDAAARSFSGVGERAPSAGQKGHDEGS